MKYALSSGLLKWSKMKILFFEFIKLIIKNIMNIKNIFEKSIESLQFFSFLTEIYFSLLEKNDSENNQIQEFIDVLGKI